MKRRGDQEVMSALERARSDSATWDELAELTEHAHRGVRGAAVLNVGRRFPDEARTIDVLKKVVAGSTNHESFMGPATIAHAAVLLLREMKSDEARAAADELIAAWPSDQLSDLRLAIEQGL